MRFAAVTLVVGFVGTILASYLQGPSIASAESFVRRADVTAELVTGSIPTDRPVAATPATAIRLIDLRNGASCKIAAPAADSRDLTRMPIGPDCAASPELARATHWRTTDQGSLVMADNGGRTVLEFMPGDGVLYESIYPANALITIVPARG